MTVAYISFGSNMGDKVESLRQAVSFLQQHPSIEVTKVSSIYDTDPVGYEDQDLFMNLVVEVKTSLGAESLLDACQEIEQQLKRVRLIRWGPRTMDLDIILYGDEIIETERLIVPHPRMHERAFVLVPLAEIAPNVIQPVENTSITELLAQVGEEGVRLFSKITHVNDFLQSNE